MATEQPAVVTDIDAAEASRPVGSLAAWADVTAAEPVRDAAAPSASSR